MLELYRRNDVGSPFFLSIDRWKFRRSSLRIVLRFTEWHGWWCLRWGRADVVCPREIGRREDCSPVVYSDTPCQFCHNNALFRGKTLTCSTEVNANIARKIAKSEAVRVTFVSGFREHVPHTYIGFVTGIRFLTITFSKNYLIMDISSLI